MATFAKYPKIAEVSAAGGEHVVTEKARRPPPARLTLGAAKGKREQYFIASQRSAFCPVAI